uniref:Uncharacterized protein n=1 Tax=Oryza brachyantha TaxID=4533 RepID=J3LZY2_ORYBR
MLNTQKITCQIHVLSLFNENQVRDHNPGRHDVVIKSVGEASGRKELDEFVTDAFDGPYREAVSALSKPEESKAPLLAATADRAPARLLSLLLAHRRPPEPACPLPPPSAPASATVHRLPLPAPS